MTDPAKLIGWGRIDPYFVWAERTDYQGLPLPGATWVPLLVHVPSDAASTALQAQLQPQGWGPVLRLGVTEPPVLTLQADRSIVAPLLAIISALGLRWELGLPFASPTPLPLGLLRRRPRVPTAQDGHVVGIIDYGCAFAHRHVRRWAGGTPGTTTRVFALWEQGADATTARQPAMQAGLAPPAWNTPFDFMYGAEWWRVLPPELPRPQDELGIDDYLQQFVRRGALDEEACYAASGYLPVQAPVTHGTHVMDAATGRPDPQCPADVPDPAPAEADIVFVQLPRFVEGRQVSGLLRTYVLDAVHYIFRNAEANTPVTINLSYGAYAGAHDGSALLDEALDAAITARRAAGGQTDIVIAAGNGADQAAHVQIDIAPQTRESVVWHNPADNPTDQFAEFWFDDAADCRLRVTPPGAAPDPAGWVGRGQWHETTYLGSPQALLIFPLEVGQSSRRRMALLAVAPTAAPRGRAAAPYGRWTVEIENRSAAAAHIRAWVERDDPVFQSGSGPRQARFEGPHVTSEDTLNSLAHGELTLTVGGFVHGSGRQPPYSARGPATAGTKRRPEWLAVCEESEALPGIAAAAVIGHERVRLPGTSVAAAVATRWVVEARRRDRTQLGPVAPPPVGEDADGQHRMPRVPSQLGTP